MKIDDYFEVMEILKTELPECFRRGNAKMPLVIGIHEAVIAHYENDARFDAATIINAIRFYCQGKKYINTIVEGAPRIDINGKAASAVTQSEASHALKILAARKPKKKT
jgi:ProP effector